MGLRVRVRIRVRSRVRVLPGGWLGCGRPCCISSTVTLERMEKGGREIEKKEWEWNESEVDSSLFGLI